MRPVAAAGSESGTSGGADCGLGFCRRGVPVVPRIDPRCNTGVMRSERFHCAEAFSRVAVGHFKMIRHTSLERLGNPVGSPEPPRQT